MLGNVVHEFALVPDVVAGGDDLGSGGEECFGYLGRDASAAGGIFAIDDAEVDVVELFNLVEMGDDCLSSGLANNIS